MTDVSPEQVWRGAVLTPSSNTGDGKEGSYSPAAGRVKDGQSRGSMNRLGQTWQVMCIRRNELYTGSYEWKLAPELYCTEQSSR